MSRKLNGKFTVTGVVAALAFSALFLTCDVGLGPLVNTEKPVVSMPDKNTAPGSFLKGNSNCIELKIDQPTADIAKVYMDVLNLPR